jgi:hypothetical protein
MRKCTRLGGTAMIVVRDFAGSLRPAVWRDDPVCKVTALFSTRGQGQVSYTLQVEDADGTVGQDARAGRALWPRRVTASDHGSPYALRYRRWAARTSATYSRVAAKRSRTGLPAGVSAIQASTFDWPAL